MSTIQETNQIFHTWLEDPSIPMEYKQLLEKLLKRKQRDSWQEALELIHMDSSMPLPVPIASWVEEELRQQSETDPKACNDLGAFYYNGGTGCCDFQKALAWYVKGDQAGELQCSENLGYLFRYGQGVEQDLTKAYYYFSKAALAGYMPSMLQLAILYEFGLGIPADPYMAYRLYDTLYNSLDYEEDAGLLLFVLFRLSRLLAQGSGCASNPRQAELLYEDACELYDQLGGQEDIHARKQKQLTRNLLDQEIIQEWSA